MPELRKGQKVKVTLEAQVIRSQVDPDGDIRVELTSGVDVGVRLYVKPDQVEAVNDPASDPIGTIRKNHNGVYIRVNHPKLISPWLGISPGTMQEGHGHMRGGEILGAVPGSPAATAA